MPQRLTRDAKNAVLGGVAAGFADYFGVDPVLARLVFVLLAFLNGIGLLAYVVAWLIMPRKDDVGAAGPAASGAAASGATPVDRVVEQVRAAGEKVVDDLRRRPAEESRGRLVAGVGLIALGVVFLLDSLPWFHWPEWARLETLWPVVLIGVGVALILGAVRSRGR